MMTGYEYPRASGLSENLSRDDHPHIGSSLNAVGLHVGSAAGQLDATLRSRRTVLTHPEQSAALIAELTKVNDRVDALRSQSARWAARAEATSPVAAIAATPMATSSAASTGSCS